MSRTLRISLATVLAAGSLLPTVAAAETVQAYSTVRGWNVESVYENGQFTGCRAAPNTRADTWSLGLLNGLWTMGVPTYRSSGYEGAVVSVDGREIDAQFGFNNGTATREVVPWELNLLKNGSNVNVRINGESAQTFSLRGSTAAIFKVQECSNQAGRAATAQPAPSQSRPAQSRPTPSPQGQFANCDMIAGGSFQCELSELSPDSGYIGAFRVDDTQGAQPSFFFQLLSEQHSDAWVSYSGGPWQFLGMWEQISQDCAVPAASQGPEAMANLGQDAWQLCLR
jgi:hypothetical protein